MAKQNLGNAPEVQTALRSNRVIVEIGGSVRRMTISNFMNVINSGDEQLLQQVAWGIPIKQNVSSPEWGVIGNTGMWNQYKSQIGRYLVTNDGKAAKLSPVDSGIFADGTTLDETKGHVMVIAPRLYYTVKHDASSGIDYLWMSMLPIGGHFIGDADGGNYICVGAYKASLSGTALTSRSGVKPAANRTISQFWADAQVNGKNWGLQNYDHRRYMMMLCLSQYGNPNVQAKIGYGVGGSSGLDLWATAQNLLTGATKSLGDSNGKINITVVNGTTTGIDCSRVSLNGIEDAWNWYWEMIQGAYFGNSANAAQTGNEIYIYEGNRMPTASELATHPSGKYRQIVRRTLSADSFGFISKMTIGEYFDPIATALGGGSNSYWCDYEYANNTGQLLLWGGDANSGSGAGLGYVHSSDAFSFSYSSCGARLAYYGPLTFMDGKALMASI